MKRDDFHSMSINELWVTRDKIRLLLMTKIEAEQRELQRRLDELYRQFGPSSTPHRQRRPYPKVRPKFHNPEQPSQTWAGRGKQPRWVEEQLQAGRSIDDLRISSAMT
jgi:DNA-binding protein H-NS